MTNKYKYINHSFNALYYENKIAVAKYFINFNLNIQ